MEAALVIGCASTAISPIAWPHYQIWLVLAALWLILLGTRRSMIIGALIYLVYSLLFAVPVVGAIAASADPSQALIPRILWELNVLVPVLISVLGLPRRVTKGAGSEPPAGLGSGQPVVPAAVVG